MTANYKIFNCIPLGNYAPVYNFHFINEVMVNFRFSFEAIERENCIGVWKIKQLKINKL